MFSDSLQFLNVRTWVKIDINWIEIEMTILQTGRYAVLGCLKSEGRISTCVELSCPRFLTNWQMTKASIATTMPEQEYDSIKVRKVLLKW